MLFAAKAWIRKSLGLFTADAGMFPGDEDNGSMGAWFILNALGLYALSPASGDYVLGSPLFANVTITIDAEAKRLDVHLSPADLEARLKAWKAPPLKADAGVLLKYARTVGSASEGAITN